MKENILLINASDEKNLSKVKEIKNLSLQLTLVGSSCPAWIKPYIDYYVPCDLKDIARTLEALATFNAMHPFHGVITFWDREVENVALITNHFRLPGSTLESIKNAKNKLLMRVKLSQNNVSQPKFFRVETLSDLENAAINLGYPFIFKPVAASASAGVFKIENHSQLGKYYHHVTSLDKPEFWLYPYLYVAEEFMDGNEVSVEGVVNQGRVYIAGITQKWKTHDYFIEYQHCFPANLSLEKTEKINEYAKQCVQALELDNTAFHIELIDHHDEIKVVEVNARMGGDFITSELLPLCGVNIAKAAIQAALGHECQLDKPRGHACIRFLLCEQTGKLMRIENDNPLADPVKKFELLKKENDSIAQPYQGIADNKLCYVITTHPDYYDCIDSAKKYLDTVKFDVE